MAGEIMNSIQLYYVFVYFHTATSLLTTTSPETSTYTVSAPAQQSSTNGSFAANLGCDDDMETFSLTNDGVNQSWSLELDNIYTINWIFLSVGAVCPAGRYGPNCAKCRKECVSCSPITGVCNQCHGPFCGDFCQHQCPANCLNATCDQTSGTCESFIEGYYGMKCDHEITTPSTLNELHSGFTPKVFGSPCVTCNHDIHVCMYCAAHQHLHTMTCQYRCSEICSSDDCFGMENNCTSGITKKNQFHIDKYRRLESNSSKDQCYLQVDDP
ncbi:multiple epidermal growth factor-like domains protein 10 [Ostrea edulis]|uniref:multiple epidermal growth factor-like domains protein 10 n=1 Tax=Ostrea edulis TaxID=37623 RepID=UPI0024AF5383|nr:multiple epidermal growth factor-like domains protein 10 [Ostrea edulis]